MLGIIFSILLTAVIYMAVPLICLFKNGGKYPEKEASKIALWNSIIVGIVMMVATISLTGEWSPGAAILYYGINRAILTSRKKDVFCTHCGNRLSSEDVFCTYCGRPLEK